MDIILSNEKKKEKIVAKRCPTCNEEKPLRCFRKGHGKGGRKTYCKKCDSERSKGYYLKNRARRIEQVKEWRKRRSKEGQEARAARMRELEEAERKKRAAIESERIIDGETMKDILESSIIKL